MTNLKLSELAELFDHLARYNDELIEDIYQCRDNPSLPKPEQNQIEIQVAIEKAKDIIRNDIEFRLNNL